MKPDSFIKQIDIIRFEKKEGKKIKDSIVDEDILEIFINGEKNFEMVFSMSNTDCLAAGFLHTQGIVRNREEILSIQVIGHKKQCSIELNHAALKRLADFNSGITIRGSSGGLLLSDKAPDQHTIPKKDFSITPDQVCRLIEMHWEHSENFRKTGALHSAALCSPDSTLSYFEDIGRHNAVDKLAGAIFINGIETENKIATLSCRMSIEIIGKIIRTKIPIVISNAAPTLGAVQLAKDAGLTIVGFARDRRFNIYTHTNRVC